MTGLRGVFCGMGHRPLATRSCSRTSWRRFSQASLLVGGVHRNCFFASKRGSSSLGGPRRLSAGTLVGSSAAATANHVPKSISPAHSAGCRFMESYLTKVVEFDRPAYGSGEPPSTIYDELPKPAGESSSRALGPAG